MRNPNECAILFSMKVKIEIDTKTFVRFWLVVIGFALAGLMIYSARTALVIIGLALFLALAMNTPVSKLAKLLPKRSRTLSTAISFTVIVALLVAVLTLVVPPIAQQTMKFIDTIPETIQTVSAQWKGVGEIVARYHLEAQVDNAIQSLQNDVASWLTNFGANFIGGINATFSFIAALFLVLVLTFLMLVEGPTWIGYLWRIYNDESKMELHKRLASRMHSVVSGYVSGQLTVSGIDGLFSGLAVFILSQTIVEVPSNLALPTIAIMFVLSLIPMFGATLGGVLVVALLAINSVPAAVIFGIYFVIYQQIENNMISPAIQSKQIQLSPLAVLVSVTIGLYVFGLLGGIISIPIAGCVKVFVDEFIKIDIKDQPKKKPTTFAKLVAKVKTKEKEV